MSTTQKRTRIVGRATGRIRPGFDRLETRLALSGSSFHLPLDIASSLALAGTRDSTQTSSGSPIAQADPAPGSVEAHSPSALTVTFAQAIDPFSINLDDFQLVHVASDGTTTPMAADEARLDESADPADLSGTRIRLTLSQALADGQYRLILSSTNTLQTTSGHLVTPSGTALEVSTFTVGTSNGGLGSAVDLGPASPTVGEKVDVLNLIDNPGAYKLYKVSVPSGHFWRLGVSVTALSPVSPLDSVVSLFDARGNLISSDDQTLRSSPGDPYLFAGVSAGTYYLGVSGLGDTPGQPGGYNPAQGTDGTSTTSQTGGAFRLDFVADPADQPTQVIGLKVDRADHQAVGLTVQFSGAISLSHLLTPGTTALTVVDASGKTWGVHVESFDASRAALSVIFDQALPSGPYTLNLAEGGHLVDLAGLTPVAPGQPSGVLGTFQVSPAASSPNDLGPIFPASTKTAPTASIRVEPGASVVKHFTVIESGLYSINGVGGSTGLEYSLTDPRGSAVSFATASDGSSVAVGYLSPGKYQLTLTNPGTQAYQGALSVALRSSMNSSLLVGGVTQGPALGLRLITPTPLVDPSVSNASGSIVNNAASGLNPQPSASPSGPAASTSSGSTTSEDSLVNSHSTSGSLVLYGLGPVGRPSSTTAQISAVGPSGPSGSVALASIGDELPSGLMVLPTRTSRKSRSDRQAPLFVDAPGNVVSAPVSSTPPDDFGFIAANRDQTSDDMILMSAAWLERIASMSLERLNLFQNPQALEAPRAEVEVAHRPWEEAGKAKDAPVEASRVEIASMAPSVGLGVLAMLAYRYRQRTRDEAKPRAKVMPQPHFGHPRKRIRVDR